MDEHPNAEILRELNERMKDGDFQAGFDILAEDVEWYEIGRDEPTRGREALRRRYQQSVDDFEIKTDMHDVLANDKHSVQLINVTATRGDKTLQYRTAEIYHMKDGKITARWAFSDDTARIVEFFG
jgi:uncharacterized protein